MSVLVLQTSGVMLDSSLGYNYGESISTSEVYDLFLFDSFNVVRSSSELSVSLAQCS